MNEKKKIKSVKLKKEYITPEDFFPVETRLTLDWNDSDYYCLNKGRTFIRYSVDDLLNNPDWFEIEYLIESVDGHLPITPETLKLAGFEVEKLWMTYKLSGLFNIKYDSGFFRLFAGVFESEIDLHFDNIEEVDKFISHFKKDHAD
jgi:hypothetical protein